MHLSEHFPLADHHTFHVEANSRYWLEYTSIRDLHDFFNTAEYKDSPRLPIGSGSNLLFDGDYPGVLLHSSIVGSTVIRESDDAVWVRVGSGTLWDDFVETAVASGWYGAENLSGIPGEVGAAAVQNIGAYGAEVGQLIDKVEAYCIPDAQLQCIDQKECRYGYRQSRFKSDWMHQYVVCAVVFKMSKIPHLNLSYADLQNSVGTGRSISLNGLRKAILKIRNAKLPDTNQMGNAGSFFMNPIVDQARYEWIKDRYPEVKSWIQSDGRVKLAAGWLIEQTGWKGRQLGRAGVHEQQALVLVNLGGATSKEILDLSARIQEDVQSKFEVALQPEVQIVNGFL